MISVIACTNRPSFVQNIIDNFERQLFKHKELIIIINENSMKNNYDFHQPNITVTYPSNSKSLGDCLNEAASLSTYDIIAKFDDDDYYGPQYLEEAYQQLIANNVQIVGKGSMYIYFKQERILSLFQPNKAQHIIDNSYTNLAGSTLLFYKNILNQIPFPSKSIGEDLSFLSKCKEQKIKMYSTSFNHYVYIRYNNHHHTSDSTNSRLKKHCVFIAKTNDYQNIVNNINGSDYDR